MSTNGNGKQFITIQIAILAVFGAMIVFAFQLMDTKVERGVEQTINLMERISVLEARIAHDEKRLDKLYETIIETERRTDDYKKNK